MYPKVCKKSFKILAIAFPHFTLNFKSFLRLYKKESLFSQNQIILKSVTNFINYTYFCTIPIHKKIIHNSISHEGHTTRCKKLRVEKNVTF